MKPILFLMLLGASALFAQPKSGEFNLGFEKSVPSSKLPDGWFQWGSGYVLKVDNSTVQEGNASVLIEPAGEKAPNSFGCVAYAIPSNYDAKEISLSAYMKLDNVQSGPIGLMIRIDGNSGTLGFDNMQQKNIQGTKDWTEYTVSIPFPQNAKTIYIGAILSGTGRLWVDNFQVKLDGKDIREAKIVKPKEFRADADKEFDSGSGISGSELTAARVEDLVVLGQVWGFLKYYHPSIAKGEFNWDYELFRVLPKILASKNQTQRNSVLNHWITTLGPFDTLRVEAKVSEPVKLTPDLRWIDQRVLGPELTKSLARVQRASRSSQHYYIGSVPGVGNPEFKNERPYSSMSYPDAGFRLLCLYRYWNIIAYYFPYKHLIEEDWNKVLSEYIPKFVNASNEFEYKTAALTLIGKISDTHANIWGTDYALGRGRRYAPLEISFVENKAVVTGYYDDQLGNKTGIRPGDVVVRINDKAVDEIVKERLPLTPASNYPTQLRDIARNLLRTNESTLDIAFIRGKKKTSTQVETYGSTELDVYGRSKKKDSCFRMVAPDIALLYPGTIKMDYLPRIMRHVAPTKGLIIDFRCYPSDFIVFALSEYLLPEAKGFAKFSVGSIENPGLFTMTNEIKVGKSNPDYYKGKTVIIVNEVTQSSAEYHTMAFRTTPNALVIGSTTAAADGNVSRIMLPGGINTMISGIGVYYPDGKETQRIGIVPDIEVKPTIKGIREGRDELLEKAIALINQP